MRLKYLYHIDSLRALAVLLVLFFHLDMSLFKGGFIGVDVFFVISGFLITRNITHEYRSNGSINFTRFYYRRVKRLLPSFLLMSVFTFVLGFLLLSPSDFIALAESNFMGSIALSNFYFLGESGYFDTAAKLKPLLHTWSLSIEEQYYFIWPLTLFVFFKVFRKVKTSLLIILLSLATIIFTIYITKTGVSEQVLNFFSKHQESPVGLQSFLFFLLPFRTYEFLMGALLVFLPPITIIKEKTKALVTVTGLLLILLPATLFNESFTYLSVLNIIPCSGIALLIIAPPSNYFSWFFNNKILREIGNASYTIYLFHWPLIVYYKHLYDQPLTFISGALLFVLSIGLSLVVYKYYETPFRHNTFKNIKLEYSKMAIMFLTFIIGSYALMTDIIGSDGWTWRLDEKNLQLIEEIGVPKKYHYTHWGGVHYKFETEIENKEKPKEAIDMVWLGDSHSGHFASGIDSILVKKHGAKVHISYVSCFILPEVRSSNEKCTLDADSVLSAKFKLLEENPNAPFVLSYYWDFRLFATCEMPDKKTGEFVDIKRKDRVEAYALLCEKIEKLRTLLGPDRKIIVIGDSPIRQGGLNYIDKLLKPAYLSFISPVSSSFPLQQSILEINNFMADYFKDLDNFYFIDPTLAFCEDGSCLSQLGNTIYFSDIDHFSIDGSIHVMEYYEDEFLSIMSSGSIEKPLPGKIGSK